MRLIIAGCRSFTNYAWLEKEIDLILSKANAHTIISGTARGADSLGERYGRARNIPVVRFPPDWKRFKRAAGPIRNHAMAHAADTLALFWDLQSRGSANMLMNAVKHNLNIFQFDITTGHARPQTSDTFL